ncbi:hypothetical protein BDZ89DRAFT_1078150, partial [Hymenopellis radicata]
CVAFDTPPPERRTILDSVHNIEQDVTSCRERIADLTAALADAEKLRRSHIGLFPPVHTLPVELLLEIFTLAVRKPYEHCSITRGPWGFGHVCRLWRQITSARSSLWSFTRCQPSPRSMLDAIFERSSPLSFDYELDRIGRTIDVLKAHSMRWRNISMHGNAQDYLQLGDVGQLPLLDSAVLHFTNPAGITRCTLAQVLDSFQYAPKLQSLTLRGYPPKGLNQLSSAFPWHQLTHLEMSLESTFLLDCQLLIHCPNLQSYSSASNQEPGSSDAVLHSELKFLDIQHVGLLSYLQCASLIALNIHVLGPDIDEDDDVMEDCVFALKTFLAQSPLLDTVLFHGAYLATPVTSLISTFMSASIETFKLYVYYESNEDLELLTASATPLLLPNLTHFKCTSCRLDDSITAQFIRSLLDVIQTRWHVERRGVTKLQSVELSFELDRDAAVDGELSFMIYYLRVLEEEGLDIAVFRFQGSIRQQLL